METKKLVPFSDYIDVLLRPSLNHKPCRLEIGGRYLYDSFSTL